MLAKRIGIALSAWGDQGGRFVGEHTDTLVALLVRELEPLDLERRVAALEAATDDSARREGACAALEQLACRLDKICFLDDVNPRKLAVLLRQTILEIKTGEAKSDGTRR